MSGIHIQNDDDFQPRTELKICLRCGKQKPTEKMDGEERCAACHSAIHAGEPLRLEPWMRDDV